MPSAHYSALKTRLNYLISRLPPAPAPGAVLTPEQEDGIAFYAVMTHAACELYMERRCKETADHALHLYAKRQTLRRVGKHLCFFPFLAFTNHEKDLKTVKELVGMAGFGIQMSSVFQASSATDIAAALKAGHRLYNKAVDSNHGISHKYQFKLLSHLGFDIKSFSPTFTSRLDQLASLRGDVAHKGVVAAQTLPSITDLPTWTSDLLAGYLDLDTAITKLRKVSS